MGTRFFRHLTKQKGGAEAVRILNILICGLLLFGCSSHREIHHESSASIGVVDTSSIDKNAARMSGKWMRLYAFCDSLNIRVWADSAVTPGGTVIHNPNIDLTAQQPVVGCESGEISAEEDSVHEESDLSLCGESSDTVDEQHEAKAAGGFSVAKWIGFALFFLLSILFYYWYYSNSFNKKS